MATIKYRSAKHSDRFILLGHNPCFALTHDVLFTCTLKLVCLCVHVVYQEWHIAHSDVFMPNSSCRIVTSDPEKILWNRNYSINEGISHIKRQQLRCNQIVQSKHINKFNSSLLLILSSFCCCCCCNCWWMMEEKPNKCHCNGGAVRIRDE